MKSNLAYIDDVMDRAIEREALTPTIPEKDKNSATEKGRKIIGGFRVFDGDAEKKALDDMIEKRRKGIEKFRADRTAIRDELSKLGITPLAICPTGAWNKICEDTGLFVFAPDSKGRIEISKDAFKGYSERSIDRLVEKDWLAFLKAALPNGRSPSSHVKATVILPDPPPEVADILCKAQPLSLTVAAVGEAIRFAEKPSDLMRESLANPKDVWAREQGYEDYQDWLKRDPIVFTEHESAAAIIAQFGDFPIEKQVVDAAVASNDLLTEKPSASESLWTLRGPSSIYEDYMNQILNLRSGSTTISSLRGVSTFTDGTT